MNVFKLSVLRPLSGGCHLVHVYTVETDGDLAWTRQHADEIALLADGAGYDALLVEELPPESAS